MPCRGSQALARVRDSDPLVRQAAATGLQDYPGSDRIAALSPLLQDSLRAVRIAAANTLASISPMIGDSLRIPYRAALLELREMMAALRIDNRFIPTRTNLAHLQNRLGKTREAEIQFRNSIRITPEYPDAYYKLGLLLAGKGDLDSAERYLRMVSVKIPGNPRIDYNLGLVPFPQRRMGKGPGNRSSASSRASLGVSRAFRLRIHSNKMLRPWACQIILTRPVLGMGREAR